MKLVYGVPLAFWVFVWMVILINKSACVTIM